MSLIYLLSQSASFAEQRVKRNNKIAPFFFRYRYWILAGLSVVNANGFAAGCSSNTCKYGASPAVLRQAIALTQRNSMGQSYKAELDELLALNVVKVIKLKTQPYGESGEGCTVRKGRFVYEGFFIHLQHHQTPQEMASSLIHELVHYREIKQILRVASKPKVTIAQLELSAFATQMAFIEQMQQQGLLRRQDLFKANQVQVFEVLSAAKLAQTVPTQSHIKQAITQLIKLGYPQQELARTIIHKAPAECNGLSKL